MLSFYYHFNKYAPSSFLLNKLAPWQSLTTEEEYLEVLQATDGSGTLKFAEL